MGELVEFPQENVSRSMAMTMPEECGGSLHIFDEVPGTCRCGEEHWTPEGTLEPGEGIGIHDWAARCAG